MCLDCFEDFLEDWEANLKFVSNESEYPCKDLFNDTEARKVYAYNKLRWECFRIAQSLGLKISGANYNGDLTWTISLCALSPDESGHCSYKLVFICRETESSFKTRHIRAHPSLVEGIRTLSLAKLSLQPEWSEIDPSVWSTDEGIATLAETCVRTLRSATLECGLELDEIPTDKETEEHDRKLCDLTFELAWSVWKQDCAWKVWDDRCKTCGTKLFYDSPFNWCYWEDKPGYCPEHQKAIEGACQTLCENRICTEFIEDEDKMVPEYDEDVLRVHLPVHCNVAMISKRRKDVSTALKRYHAHNLCERASLDY